MGEKKNGRGKTTKAQQINKFRVIIYPQNLPFLLQSRKRKMEEEKSQLPQGGRDVLIIFRKSSAFSN